jgi:tetratricopeptide (TPR) repeat protein
MTAIAQTFSRPIRPWALAALVGVLTLGLGAAPVLAQDNGDSSKKQKTEQLKQAYRTFQQAGKQNDYETAYSNLAQATQLADELGQSGALSKLQSFQQKLPTKWGNEALEAENYSEALRHFNRGIEWSPKDAYVFYGKGLALVNMDSTESAMQMLQEAKTVGEETGNTRVSGLATDRIRQEYVARASKALNTENPSPSDAETALEALDQMREYVEPSASSLFYRSVALQAAGDLEAAVETARQGLEMHQGSRSDAAKYHFVIAESQMDLGQKDSACASFEKAAFGDYRARSEHYLKNNDACQN